MKRLSWVFIISASVGLSGIGLCSLDLAGSPRHRRSGGRCNRRGQAVDDAQ